MDFEPGSYEMILCSSNISAAVQFELDTIIEQDDKNSSSKLNVLEKINDNLNLYNAPLEPCEGMIFDDLEDAHACYKTYSMWKSFTVRKNHTWLSRKDKSLISVDYVCSREGYNQSMRNKKDRVGTEQAVTRIGCKAMLSLKKEEQKWIVNRFVDDHNHEFCTLKSTRLLRGHGIITPAQKNFVNMLNEAGIPTRKITSILDEQPSGENNIRCTSSGIQNYLCNKRKGLLKIGYARRMYNYFKESQAKNPGFFYAIEMDNYSRMQNCFWANTRSRDAYHYFGVAVTFDAT